MTEKEKKLLETEPELRDFLQELLDEHGGDAKQAAAEVIRDVIEFREMTGRNPVKKPDRTVALIYSLLCVLAEEQKKKPLNIPQP